MTETTDAERDYATAMAFVRAVALAVVKLDKSSEALFVREFDLAADAIAEGGVGGVDVAAAMRVWREQLAGAVVQARRMHAEHRAAEKTKH